MIDDLDSVYTQHTPMSFLTEFKVGPEASYIDSVTKGGACPVHTRTSTMSCALPSVVQGWNLHIQLGCR